MTEMKGQVSCHQITSVEGGTDGGGGGELGDRTNITVVAAQASAGEAAREPYRLRADSPAAANKWIAVLRAASQATAADRPAPSTNLHPSGPTVFAPGQARQPQQQQPETRQESHSSLGAERQSAGMMDAIRLVQEAEVRETATGGVSGGAASGDDVEAAQLRRQVVSSMGFDEALVEQVQAEQLYSTGIMFASADELVEAVLLAEARTGAQDTGEYERGQVGMQSEVVDQVMLQPVAVDQVPEVTQVTALAPPPAPPPAALLSPPMTSAVGLSGGNAPSGVPVPVGTSLRDEDARAYIMSLGFERGQVDAALVAGGGDKEQAVEILLANAAA
jgi:hypothetical protein